MPNTVLEHNRDNVYLYVGNNRDQHRPDLESVTYLDSQGSAHTVHVPKDANLGDAHSIISAVHDAHEAQQQEVRRIEAERGSLSEADRERLSAATVERFTARTDAPQGGAY